MLAETKKDKTLLFSVDVVLVEPEIPQNTGNIARTCAALGCKLHLIGPLGFSLTTQRLRRAGVDYWNMVEVERHPDMETFLKTHTDGVFYFFTQKGLRGYHEVEFRGRNYFVFGKESTGLPEELIARYPDYCLRIPMRQGMRSLNVSTAAALALYEAFRQNRFPNLHI